MVIDNVDQFEAFEDSIEDKYISQFISITSSITQLSEYFKPLPHGKRRKLKGKGLENTGEFRSRDLRLYYLVLKESGYIICLGGGKKSQPKDLKRLKSLKKEILNQVSQHGQIEIIEKKKAD